MSIERRWRRFWTLSALFLASINIASTAWAQSSIRITKGEVTFAPGDTIPTTGWAPLAVPSITKPPANMLATRRLPTTWVRLYFDRSAVAKGEIALFGDFMKENFTLYLNGTPLFRSASDPDNADLDWYRPMFVPFPPNVLHAGRNEIVFKSADNALLPMGVGTINIGAKAAMRTAYGQRYSTRITGPQMINGVIAVLTVCFVLLWAGRPKDVIFGWIALVGFAWWVRNLHYYVVAAPIPDSIFWALTMDSVFVVLAATLGFAATFFDVPHRRNLILFTVLTSVFAACSRYMLRALDLSDLPSFLMTIPAALATVYILARACLATPTAENVAMLAAVALATLSGFHDLGLIKFYWEGASFFLMPYGSLLVFSAFAFAQGRRVLHAFSAVEDINRTLEIRVDEAMVRLGNSEADRAALQVAHAVDGERERLMREIHDGIGSSLITALAGAKRRQESPETIATLTRSLADLRIGVDSLEPVNGDVVLLLASLRHRMERELKGAGLAFIWKVKAAPSLSWLDPVGALHVLRILQEAIGNIVTHAKATFVTVTCGAAQNRGTDGVLIEIVDDGKGFSVENKTSGKGLTNMAGRADAIQAKFWIESRIGYGVKLSIWLPLKCG